MFQRWQHMLQPYARGRWLVAAVVATLALQTAMGWFATQGPGVVPDLRLAPTAQRLAEDLLLAQPYRKAFLLGHLLVDTLYALAYGMALALLLLALYRPRPGTFPYAMVLPGALVLTDFLENLLLVVLMSRAPHMPQPLLHLAASVIQAKWLLVAMVTLVVLAGMLRPLFRGTSPGRARRALAWGVAALLALGLAGVSFAYFGMLRRGLPRVQGTLSLPGLHHTVTVYRDRYGVPHIVAQDAHDLFFAQGVVHAQDRLWQMESFRRAVHGRLSEIIGLQGLDNDRLMRTLGLSRVAQAEWETLDAESRAALQAYADGVNAYLRAIGDDLPPEFRLLGLQPEPWRPVDSLAFAKLLAWGLSNNVQHELLLARMGLANLDEATRWALLPEYPGPFVIPDAQQASLEATAAVLNRTLARAAAVNPLLRPDQGSNAWVVAGSRTASGRPLLANDPHQTLSMPGLWYLVGLHTTDRVYQVVGGSLPGVPGVILGRNAHIAWGVTNARPDVQDLFMETLNDAGTHYLFQGQWRPLETREEIILVKGADPVVLTVRSTHHGPLISDALGEPSPHPALALRWTGLEPHPLQPAVLNLDRARNWDEFRAAVRLWAVPGMNFVYADTAGNIGYQMSGLVPIRANDQGQGVLPVDGASGAYEWVDFIPWEAMPHARNPVGGLFVSANTRPVGPKYPYFLGRYFQPPYRMVRIGERLRAGQAWTVEGFAQLHTDVYSALNHQLARALATEAHPASPAGRNAQALLAAWDGHMRADSPAATLSEVALRHTIRLAVEPALGPDGATLYLQLAAYPYMFLQTLLDDPTSPWWHGDRAGLLTQALEAAVADLSQTWPGSTPTQWVWGALHPFTFAHPVGRIGPLAPIFNRGPYPMGGNWNTVNSGAYYPDRPYAMGLGPALRLVADLSDSRGAYGVAPAGQSGHPLSRHYADQVPLWRAGHLIALPLAPDAVEAETQAVLVLQP